MADIQLNLQKFEQEAKKLLDETGADHVVYGMKIYEDGQSERSAVLPSSRWMRRSLTE